MGWVRSGLGGGKKEIRETHSPPRRQPHSHRPCRGLQPRRPPTYSPSSTSPPCPFPSLVTPMSATDSSLPPQAVTSLEVVGLACDAQPASRPSDVVSHSSRCAILPTSRSKRCRQSWTRSHHGWLCCHVTPSRVVHGRRCPLSPFCPTSCRCGGADCSLCCAWRAPLEERRTGGRPQRPRGQAVRHVDA